MARINDYASLKTAVLGILERSVDDEAHALFDQWVSMCEAEYAATLRAPWLTRIGRFTYGDNPNQRFEWLPPSFNGMITLHDGSSGAPLEPINSAEQGWYLFPQNAPWPLPRGYMITGLQLQVLPDPGAPVPMVLTYYSKGEPLEETPPANVNSIIVQAPLIYYYGVLKFAGLHYGEVENAAGWGQIFADAIEKQNELEAPWRRGAGARVRVTR